VLHSNVWREIVGVEKNTVIEDVVFDKDSDSVVVHVRPRRSTKRRCGVCGVRAPLYDQGEGRRNWRSIDVGTLRCFLQADSPRVSCPDHGPTVAQVPWARHGAGHTMEFDDQCAWLVTNTSKSAVSELLRIAWRTVGSIVERVVADARAAHDPFDGLTRIGIDEISYKKGHKYLTVVVDHDSGRLVWAAVGRDTETLRRFFDLLGEPRSKKIRLVSADAASWIAAVVEERCPKATLCIDGFHTVQWATEALDEVRRSIANAIRAEGHRGVADATKKSRYALLHNPDNMTADQKIKLATIARTNHRLYRAYLIKEQLRLAVNTKGTKGIALLDDWLTWTPRCRIPQMVELGQKVRRHLEGIKASMQHDISNALVESTNTKIRVLHRVAFGFKKPEHLIALALLDRGGYCPTLPGRAA